MCLIYMSGIWSEFCNSTSMNGLVLRVFFILYPPSPSLNGDIIHACVLLLTLAIKVLKMKRLQANIYYSVFYLIQVNLKVFNFFNLPYVEEVMVK